MKSLAEIERHVLSLAERIGASHSDLPTYGTSREDGSAHVEIADGSYHYVVVERGRELSRRSSTRYDDIMYWILRDATRSMAFTYELQNRIEDRDPRRIAFPMQIALMGRISAPFAKRLDEELAEILRGAPYDDEAVARLSSTGREDSLRRSQEGDRGPGA